MLRSRSVLLLVLLAHATTILAGASTYITGVVAADGVAYFGTRNAMCRTDGTREGTRCFPIASQPFGEPVLLNGKVYTLAYADPYGYGAQELWGFDGQSAPAKVMRFNGYLHDLSSNGTHLLLLLQRHIPDGVRLMRTDGTEAGTSLVKILQTDSAAMRARTGGSVLLRVRATAKWTPRDKAYALWATDGTRDGTAFLLPESAWLYAVTELGNVVLFRLGSQLWRTDGTAAGTFQLFHQYYQGGPIAVRDGIATFASWAEVWRTDGTNVVPLRLLSFSPAAMEILGSQLILAEKQKDATIIWAAGETSGDPILLAKIAATADTFPYTPRSTHAGTLAYFYVKIAGGAELWRSDGTVDGTHRLGTFSDESFDPRFTPLGERLLFFPGHPSYGIEPWATDGTREGTFMLANLSPEGRVRGTVVEAATWLPIAGAIVRSPGSPAGVRTNSDGRYTIEGAIGRFSLEALGDDYLPTLQHDIEVAAHEEVIVDFKLTKGARIAGRVADPAGNPLAEITVKVTGGDGTSLTLRTRADGHYETGLLSTKAGWAVEADTQRGHNRAVRGGIRLTAGQTENVDLIMQPFGRLRIRLLDSVTHGPMRSRNPGIRVVSSSDESRWWYADISLITLVGEVALPDGYYQVASFTPTYWNAWYQGPECGSADAYCWQSRLYERGSAVRCLAGTTTTIDLELRPKGSSIRGVVVDAESGALVPNVYVRVHDQSSGYLWSASPLDGRFESDADLPDGVYEVMAWSLDANSLYSPTSTTAVVRSADGPRVDVEIRLVRDGALRQP